MEAAHWAVFRASGPWCSSCERRPRLREQPFHPTPKQGRWSIQLVPESSRFQRRLASRVGREVRDDGGAFRKLWLDLDTGLGKLIVGQHLTPTDAVLSITREGSLRRD